MAFGLWFFLIEPGLHVLLLGMDMDGDHDHRAALQWCFGVETADSLRVCDM
jgi:hypothetical protein